MCFVIPSLARGGAERSVAMTACGLAERGHKVDIVISEAVLEYPELLSQKVRLIACCSAPPSRSCDSPASSMLWRSSRVSRARLIRLVPSLFSSDWRVVAQFLVEQRRNRRARHLASYLKREQPDIVFANLPQVEYTAHFAARLVSPSPVVVPVLRNTHGAVSSGSGQSTRRRLYVWRQSESMIAVSNGVAQWARCALADPASNVAVIYNPSGSPPNVDRLAKEALDHPWFGDGGLPVVLGAGRLVQQKDFGLLIDAFHHMQGEHPSRLVILGEGPMRRELEERLRRLGLEDRVSMPGLVTNPFAYMSRAALFVMSSRHEGFGNVLVEAMACGCPAVSTDCPAGPAEILEDPELLSPVGDPEALARVMSRQLSRPADKVALRARAARFSLERTVDGYEQWHASLLRCAPAARKGTWEQ